MILSSAMRWLEEYYESKLEFADPRVADWPLMSSPWPTTYIVLAYMLLVTLGPRVVRKPMIDGRLFMIAYNSSMALINAYILWQILYNSYRSGYSLYCQPVSYESSGPEYNICCALYLYFITKPLEFTDSVLFVLRCKPRQLSFLHVYHHVSMVAWWWIIMKWVGGGCAVYGAGVNSFVHVIMYYYYARTAAWPSSPVWWKKHLTAIQLAQFTFTIVITSAMLLPSCRFPKAISVGLILYMISFVALFTRFYRQNYKSRKLLEGKPSEGAVAEAETSNSNLNQGTMRKRN